MIRNLTRATRFVNNFHSSIQRYNNYKILQASSPLVNMQPRWFSTKHDAEESVQEVDHVQIETPEGKFDNYNNLFADKELKEREKSDIVTSYKLIPVTEHPIFPGSSQALSISKDQYEVSYYNNFI